MIRVVASTSGVSARAYFRSGLARADYYAEEILGKWHGQAAPSLGLAGEVREEQFTSLIENRHPVTGDKLNPRVNGERIVGWDINFHAPKSLSLALSLGGDQRLLEAFRASVAETMRDIEAQTQTRIRRQGREEDRPTANLCWAEFVHLTARPVDGIPDPHLHIHAYTFNTSFDPVEERWKAAKIQQARRDMPLHQARFHARLAQRVKALGYPIRRTRHGWEIAGIDNTLLEKFSRRTREIERIATERGLSRDEDKDKLGALTRQGKRHGLRADELIQAWTVRLTPEEQQQLTSPAAIPSPPVLTAKDSLDHAFEKTFARDAVVKRNNLLAEALRYGVGHVSPEAIEAEYRTRPVWEKDYHGETLLTHDQVLAEEIALVTNVRNGKGKHSALAPGQHVFRRNFLSGEQQAAVNHILHSHDRVIAIRGGAGTGKTTAMQEAVDAIEAQGYTVIALAPSADASRETLRKTGFANADAVAQFLANPKLQQQARGQVLWIDEAGLLGTRDLHAVTQTAGPNTRIILTGDTRQHAPVPRGNAFHTLQQFAGLRCAEITHVRRQEPSIYKEAVSDLSRHNLKSAFLKLDAMGAIREIPDHHERYHQLAIDYTHLSTAQHKPLVVSPTHREGREVTAAIRQRLSETKKLGEERAFPRYRNLQWETAEKREPERYEPGQMVQYHQNGKGVKRGDKLFVSEVTPQGEIKVTTKTQTTRTLNLTDAQRFQVFTKETISLAPGDRIRLTRNGFSRDKRRHSNGNLREIDSFTPEGHLRLTTGAILDKDDGHWTYGYCTTSHSSQSKSVKDVLIAQSSDSLAAASQEQFYVSVSRGKQRIRIYTDDRRVLQESVGISEKSCSALELARESGRRWDRLLERELDRHAWKDTLRSRQQSKEAGKKTKLPAHTAPTTPRSWTDSITRRRGHGEFRSPNAPSWPKAHTPNRRNNPRPSHKPQPYRLLFQWKKRFQQTRTWMRSTSVLRSAQKKYRQIRAFTRRTSTPEKVPAKTSVKPRKMPIVRRPVLKRT